MSRAEGEEVVSPGADAHPVPDKDEAVWIVSIRRVTTSSAPSWERQWALASPQVRRALPFALSGLLLLLGFGVYLSVRTVQAGALERRVSVLEAEREQLRDLALLLEEVEEGYARLRGLFAPEGADVGALWLPPAGATSSPRSPIPAGAPPGDGTGEGGPPSLWPLTERGFLTQGLIAGRAPDDEASTHPGIDLAVPSGSYIRAVAGGTVVERGEDPVYGLFVLVDHGGGYRSLYAHASVLTAEPGRGVVMGEVLGLTGSSGRSTAPHLHLEITRDGVHVDPLTLLRRP